MTHKEMEILAKQVDMMAEQADVMRAQIKGLISLLGREETAAHLSIKSWELTALRTPTGAKMSRWNHATEREREARAIAREAAIDALIREAKTRRDDLAFDEDDGADDAANEATE